MRFSFTVKSLSVTKIGISRKLFSYKNTTLFSQKVETKMFLFNWKRFNGSQLAKLERVFFSCHFHEIYRVEAASLKNSNNSFKITTCLNMWFETISLKIDIFFNYSLMKVRIWQFFSTYGNHVTVIIYLTANVVFTLSIFS